MCICKGVGGGVCFSGVEVNGYLSKAFRLHFGKFMQSKLRQFHYARLHEVSSSLQLKNQLSQNVAKKD